MPHPFQIFSQSDYLIQIVDINSHTEWQAVQIQISWLLQKPTDLDLHCLQKQGISGFSRTRVKIGFMTLSPHVRGQVPIRYIVLYQIRRRNREIILCDAFMISLDILSFLGDLLLF